ncbi:GNAT family N-acetyltransferase [Nocardioides panacisoli]|uniref:GNAT family N-acetyltransferase n=1 Tax=Nocardioides panacisoli TaxID=627624 RepID=UPI001C62D3AF|nr:GNAT family N-acetyltransferase [Nocardioides panacisoli]QYJ04110.1 GNAT family N-acetyltransferase [Nocardioides panacisoli]
MSPSGVRLRHARAVEAAELSRLALRSKAHWGYDEDFLEACRDELTYTADQCTSGGLVVAETNGRVRGFRLVEGDPPVGELVALFVSPDAIGQGLGGVLLRDALTDARRRGHRSLLLDADPDAEPFYRHLGAERIGTSPSGSIPGRVLPRLRFDLTGAT